jgi:ATP-dependent Clp protease adaptor protein ClpS
MAYCEHQMTQAEQCALIVHNNGKCAVKNGTFDDLKPICEALLEQGLTAKIQ